MKILFVANTLPPHDVSGAGEQVVQLARGLEEAGHEVMVLGRGPGGARGPKVLFPLTIVPPAWRVLRRVEPDVVQVHESDAALVAVLVRLRRWLRKGGPPLLALLQVSYREEIRAVRPLRDGERILGRPGPVEHRFVWTKAPVQVIFGWLTARLADRVLAPSRKTGEELVADYGVEGPVEVLPNVTGGTEPVEPREDRVRRPPGYFLYVGRLRIRKGVEVLYHALAEGGPELGEARLLVAGSGEQEKALDDLHHRLDLGERVERLGRCDAGEVRALLAGARALVVPSTYEGMPLVVLEAMRAGVAVIASAVSGIPEVVVDGKTGWLVPPEDPWALSEAMREALTDAVEAERRGEAGRQRVESLYTPARAAATWLETVGRMV